MANLAKSGRPSLATVLPPTNSQPWTGAIAGEDLAAGDALRLHTDGRFYRLNGAADNAAARYKGVAATDASAGEAVTPLCGVVMHYGSGLTPGAPVFASPDVLGGIADANATVDRAIGHCVDTTRVYFNHPDR